MSMVIVGKGYEITPYMDEFEYEDTHEVAYEIIRAAKEHGKTMMWVSAGNIDWRGSSGYGVFDLDENDHQKFWQQLAGVNADWTLRTITNVREGRDFGCMVSHHDAPTGGLRKVHLMSPHQAYDRLRKELEIPRKDIIDHFDTYTYNTDMDGRITNEMILEAIAYAGADHYQDLVETA